ncbi:putative long-chain-fatty-acid CoA ligase [Corchorus olitorius]|uniref:Long-chain-fatty-acid CoA ligase n=1 Tax=Corchorus olitorius TaxID=93759 RepID=A0A1R3FWH5_9ROSI|nr:putative long-chain-fatty-acid CoA ligase [Corchorus olitorius]
MAMEFTVRPQNSSLWATRNKLDERRFDDTGRTRWAGARYEIGRAWWRIRITF